MTPLTTARRIVVKVGTSVLTERGGDTVSPSRVRAIAGQVARLHTERRQVLVVTSGAIGAGMRILGYRRRPTALRRLQAASAAGQSRLMQLYDAAFAEEGFHAAQLLLTKDDLRGRRRRNVTATVTTLLAAGVIPVINENDSVSTDEIRVGDNDQLAAHVAVLAGADALVILTDVDGFYDRRGAAPTAIPHVSRGRMAQLARWARGTAKATSTGGMRTKLLAATIVTANKIPLVIANGHHPHVLTDLLLKGKMLGTVFAP